MGNLRVMSVDVCSSNQLGWVLGVPLATRTALDFHFGLTSGVATGEVVQACHELGFQSSQLFDFRARLLQLGLVDLAQTRGRRLCRADVAAGTLDGLNLRQ